MNVAAQLLDKRLDVDATSGRHRHRAPGHRGESDLSSDSESRAVAACCGLLYGAAMVM